MWDQNGTHVRVIAGNLKSRPLRTLPGRNTRPTSDRLRETLFNVLTAGDPTALENSIWLDLFAGSGAIGIEALSRGAHSVTFVDSSRAATKVIRENLKSLGIVEGFEVLEHEAVRALRQLDGQALACDYVFIDPPYKEEESYHECLGFLSQSRILKMTSIVIAEHDKRFNPDEAFGALKRYRTLTQGDSSLSFYQLV
jgi:16S rRNA (guanine(966)-N(2))-methyltransferase RsmD